MATPGATPPAFVRGARIAALALVTALLVTCRGKKEEEAAPVITVDVAPVLLSQIQRTVRADGVLYPKQQAAIVPKVSAPKIGRAHV